MSNQLSTVIGILAALGVGITLGYILGGLKNGSASQNQITGLTTQLESERGKVVALDLQLQQMRAETAGRATFDASLNAVKESIGQISEAAKREDLRRVEAETALKSQMEQMATQNKSLLDETTKLAGALSHSQARGKYGEAQLEALLKSAGLLEGPHFEKQNSRDSIRPDILIKIPGGAELFIDSKFPFDAFFSAVAESDPLRRREGMKEHAKALANHVNELAKKEYQTQGNSADYVILFVPFESILSEALEVNPNILNEAFEKKISIASPATMLAMLRTVAHVYSQSDMAENAEKIKELAARFLQRAGLVHEKIEKLGDTIRTTGNAFNSLVASAESNLLVPAREMARKGVPKRGELNPIREITEEVRAIKINQPALNAIGAQDDGDFEEESEE